MHLNELILKGGVLMWPMILMSIISLYIIIDRIIIFLSFGKINNEWTDNIINLLSAGKIDYVTEEVKKNNNITSNVFNKIFKSLKSGLDINYVDNLSTQYAQYEIQKLNKKLSVLSIIASSATMIGFLGTVLGLITAFNTISQTTEAVTPNLIAGGIYEAMITTAVGLLIGILSDFSYKIFISSLNKKVSRLEDNINALFSIIRQNNIDFR